MAEPSPHADRPRAAPPAPLAGSPALELPPLPPGHHLSAAWVWAKFHLGRNLMRRPFWLWLGALVGLQALLSVTDQVHRAHRTELFLIYLAPFVALFFTTGVVREEIEDQTLTYGHCRPVDRAWLYGARVVAALLPVFLINLPGALGSGMQLGDPGAPLRFAGAALLSAVAHGAVFALLGLLVKWPTWIGLAWLIFWEAPVSKLPGFFGNFTLAAQVRALAGVPPAQLVKTPWLPHEPPTAAEATVVLLVVAGLGLWVGGALMRRRETEIGK